LDEQIDRETEESD